MAVTGESSELGRESLAMAFSDAARVTYPPTQQADVEPKLGEITRARAAFERHAQLVVDAESLGGFLMRRRHDALRATSDCARGAKRRGPITLRLQSCVVGGAPSGGSGRSTGTSYLQASSMNARGPYSPERNQLAKPMK